MDILLIQPPIRDFYLTAKRTVPYGLACIAAALKCVGFSVGILDALATAKSRPLPLPPEMVHLKEHYGRPDTSPFRLFHGYRHFGYSFQHLESQIRASGASLVGISSLFTAYAAEAEETARVARRALPEAAIVVGGHHPTAMPESVMAWGPVDYLIRGEGEAALPALANALASKTDVSGVPGIVFRREAGGLHISSPAVMTDPDAFPAADRSLVKGTYYTRGPRPATVVVTSRGCPMGCSYCALGNRNLYPYRRRSVASVVSEIREAVQTYGARFIDFEDENLSFSKPWFLSLLEEITRQFRNEGVELRAMNGLYPPTLDEAVVAAMKGAGFRALNLSLGSTSTGQLKRFRRPDARGAFDNCLALAEKHGLDAVGYVICGAPGQDAGRSLEDLLYLATRRVLAGLSVFYPAPGSDDYETCRRLGLLPSHTSLFRASTLPLSHTTTRLQSITLVRLARIINFMKALIDRGHPISPPAPLSSAAAAPGADRFETGARLLSAFFYDGRIRGITPQGEIYSQPADDTLVHRFLDRIKNLPVAGTQGRSNR